jgi:SAM-dependent methyltransferase
MSTPPKSEPNYSQDYFEKYGAGKKSYSHASATDPSHLRILKEILTLNYREGAILDIGCATGTFLKLAKEHGFKTYGVEISDWAAKKAAEVSGADVFCLDLSKDKLPLPDASLDVVTMNECIEHIPNHYHALEEVRRVLKPKGLLFVHTPILFSRFLQDSTHVTFFTKDSLPFTVERAGFQVIVKGLEGGPLQKWRVPRILRILSKGDFSQPLLFPYVRWAGRFMSCYAVKKG